MNQDIVVGDVVLMEYAEGITATVVVEEIDEHGNVYATDDDGEPYTAPMDHCDKVPY